MKKYEKPVVISPSAHIVSEFDEMTPAQQIELCSRVCYKSEDQMTPESALDLSAKMVEHKHNSTLEMAPLTFRVLVDPDPGGLDSLSSSYWYPIRKLFEINPKYLVIDKIERGEILISGSIRSFRELVMFYPDIEIGWSIANSLRNTGLFFDIVFPDNLSKKITVKKLSVEQIDELSPELHIRHRQVLAKFIVNRAVTHEIVRHRPCSFLQESQRYCRYNLGKFGKRVTYIKPMFFAEGGKEYGIWEKSVLASEQDYMELLKTSTPQAARTVLPNSCKTELLMLANLVEWEHFFHLRCGKPAEPSMREVTIPLREEFCEKFPQHSFNRRMPEGWIEK